MKKGKRIGMNKSKAGISGEKYIIFEKSIKRYWVMVPTNRIGEQKKIGRFEKLEDAILCRDKYLSSTLFNSKLEYK